jgi:hypothetical protein
MELIPIDLSKKDTEYTAWLGEQLERGNILLLTQSPFLPPKADGAFLREQRQTESASHKNIAYKPKQGKITGADAVNAEDSERMRAILAAYSQGAMAFLTDLFPQYAQTWRVDYASFRPLEEQGRNLPLRHRNDLMHLDAFPTRPTHGGRILRLFTNMHATRDRVWGTADPFEDLAQRYALAAGLKEVVRPWAAMRRKLSLLGRLIGIHVPDRSPYDEFMLRFHNYLKGNSDFQQNGQREIAVFPPGASWITFTDQVAHKALSGQYALEQTCIVPYPAMTLPELAPVYVLEKIAGCPLVNPGALAAGAEKPERVPA